MFHLHSVWNQTVQIDGRVKATSCSFYHKVHWDVVLEYSAVIPNTLNQTLGFGFFMSMLL